MDKENAAIVLITSMRDFMVSVELFGVEDLDVTFSHLHEGVGRDASCSMTQKLLSWSYMSKTSTGRFKSVSV